MFKIALSFLHDYFEHLLSYLTALMALMISLPLMKIGGGVLLLARLVSDLPPAFQKVKEIKDGYTKGDSSK
jgi:hypothetical protein